ncbi:MAG: hypothetical protein AAB692_01625 [Patescibacteria group bacterium]
MTAIQALKRIVRRQAFGYAAVFSFALAIAGYIQWTPTFIDPDSFYHVKMAQIIAAHGPVRDFPWLPMTKLAGAFADHHFLYHVILIPFVIFLGPIVGAKTATALMVAAVITVFYALLRAYGVRAPAFFAAVLATTGGFMFRMNLVKTSALSVTVLLLALLAFEKKKTKLLFALSWLYVWAYGGWPLILAVVGAAVAARVFTVWKIGGSTEGGRSLAAAASRCRADFHMAAATTGGAIAGLVINPDFPRNLAFYWEQFVQIGVIGYRNTIGVGGEWYPYDFTDIFGNASLIFLLFLFGLTALLAAVFWDSAKASSTSFAKRDPAPVMAAMVLAAIFLAMALRSKRHIEYFAPFMALFTALFLDAVTPKFSWRELPSRARKFIAEHGLVPAAAAIYLIAVFPVIAIRDIRETRAVHAGGLPITKYAAAARWLRDNTPDGSLVFHSDWDDFPPLFYQDDRNHYVSGLDPTFFYRQDPLRYWQWVNITSGKRKSGLAEIIGGGFHAAAVLVEKDHKEMRRSVEADGNFKKVYSDDEVDIYESNASKNDSNRPAGAQ